MGFQAAPSDPAEKASPLRTELPAGSAAQCVTLRDPYELDKIRRTARRELGSRLFALHSLPGLVAQVLSLNTGHPDPRAGSEENLWDSYADLGRSFVDSEPLKLGAVLGRERPGKGPDR